MLAPNMTYDTAAMATFRVRCEALFATLESAGDHRVRLDALHLRCLASMSATSEAEELEDWICAIEDALKLVGRPIPPDELDLDQVCGVAVPTYLAGSK
jgi:hypothetical protein